MRHRGKAWFEQVFLKCLSPVAVIALLIEVPVMLMLVEFCQRTAFWFPRHPETATLRDPRCILPGE